MKTDLKPNASVPDTDVPDDYFRFHLPHIHIVEVSVQPQGIIIWL